MKSRQLPKIYRQEKDFQIQPVFLTDEQYIAAISAFVVVASDVIIANRQNKTLYLPFRKVEPAAGPWPIGGRRKSGETALDCAIRCFKRETKLELEKERLNFIGINEYVWKTRKEKPTDAGMHNLHYAFFVELSGEEIEKVSENLDLQEYDAEKGLQEYSRQDMEKIGAKQIIFDYYDAIFES